MLQDNYAGKAGLEFENVAITIKPGPVNMWMIDPAKWKYIAGWTHGISTMYPQRNAIRQHRFRKHTIYRTVPGERLQPVLDTHKVDKIDLLQIDAEGTDYHIMKQLDFRMYAPAVINFEYRNLPKSEQAAARRLLRNNGYDIYPHGKWDLTALHHSRIAVLQEQLNGKDSRPETDAESHSRPDGAGLGR
jgi:hypothetical protein